MDCKTTEELICAALESGMLDAEAARHVDGCDACRAFRDDIGRHDADLRAAFEPGKREAALVAERTIAALRREPLPQMRTLRFFPIAIAAAAGFLIAALVFRPWRAPAVVDRIVEKIVEKPIVMDNSGQVPELKKRPMAKLEIATGTVQASKDGTTWTNVDVGGGCEMDTWVRCSPQAKAEFTLSDDSVVRLDTGTNCFFGKFRQFKIDSGRLYARAAQGRVNFTVTTENGFVSLAKPGTIDVFHDIVHEKKVVETATTILVLDGAAKVHCDTSDADVDGPARILIVADKAGAPQKLADGVMATAWIHDLLARRGESDELTARVKVLLASDLVRTEPELRKIGESCAKPIAAWACGGDSRGCEDLKRRQAVAIAADLATTRTIPELISLLEDGDGTIRLTVAKALERLTGLTQGCSPGDWTSDPASKTACEKWKAWQSGKEPKRDAVK